MAQIRNVRTNDNAVKLNAKHDRRVGSYFLALSLSLYTDHEVQP